MSYSGYSVSRVYAYIGRSPRTEFQVRQYLTKRKVASEKIEEIIIHLYELKLLDDAAYAGAFVRTQNIIKPNSKRLLLMKLRKKGVAPHIASQAIDKESLDEDASAKELLRRNAWRWEKLDDREKTLKSMNYLMRLGFNGAVAKRVIMSLKENST